MASLTDIENQIEAKKNELVPSLNSSSKFSVWRLFRTIISFAIFSSQETDEVFKKEIEELIARKQALTLGWYQNQTLAYLYGKAVLWDDRESLFYQELGAEEEAEDFKLVSYCAVVRERSAIKIKVAKDDAGTPSKLTAGEESAVTSYLSLIKGAGDTIEIVNNDPDDLSIEIDVYVDPLLIDVTTGALISDGSVKPVEDAIDNYLLDLDFDGAFVINHFIDSIQAAQGVKNPVPVQLQHKYGAFPYEDIEVSVIANAGYFQVASLTINYKS